MKPITDLEALVRQLSGRGDQGIDLSSDQSQILEAIRARTRDLFEDREDSSSTQVRQGVHAWGVAGSGRDGPGRFMVDPRRWGLILVLVTASLCSGMAGVWWLGERSASIRSHNQTSRLLKEIDLLLAAKPPTDVPVIGKAEVGLIADHWRKLEIDLTEIRTKLDALSRLPLVVTSKESIAAPQTKDQSANRPDASQSLPAPELITLKADLAMIRRELASGEAATTRQVQEMRTILHELNTVVRRVLSRPQPTTDNNVTLPLLAVAVQALINNLQHQTAQVRGDAVQQLTRLGPLARSALPALQQMMTREPDPNVRSAVETAVSVISTN